VAAGVGESVGAGGVGGGWWGGCVRRVSTKARSACRRCRKRWRSSFLSTWTMLRPGGLPAGAAPVLGRPAATLLGRAHAQCGAVEQVSEPALELQLGLPLVHHRGRVLGGGVPRVGVADQRLQVGVAAALELGDSELQSGLGSLTFGRRSRACLAPAQRVPEDVVVHY